MSWPLEEDWWKGLTSQWVGEGRGSLACFRGRKGLGAQPSAWLPQPCHTHTFHTHAFHSHALRAHALHAHTFHTHIPGTHKTHTVLEVAGPNPSPGTGLQLGVMRGMLSGAQLC